MAIAYSDLADPTDPNAAPVKKPLASVGSQVVPPPAPDPSLGGQTYQQPNDFAGAGTNETGSPVVQTGVTPAMIQSQIGATDTNGMTPGDGKQLSPAAQPPGPPQVASTLPTIGADAPDLRYGVVAPTDSARLTGIQGQADAATTAAGSFDAAKSIAGNTDTFGKALATPDVAFSGVNTTVNAGPSVDPTVSADLANYRAKQMAASDALASGPTRSQIAQQQLDSFDLKAQPQLRDQLRSVGQRAAALGRIGNGQTAVEALTPYTDYLNNRSALEKDLAASTATGEIADRQANLAAQSGLVGSQNAQDTSARGEQRTERANAQDVATGNVTRAMDQSNTALSNAQQNAARQAQIRQAAVSSAIGATGLTGDTTRANAGILAGREAQVGSAEAAARGETRTERQAQLDASAKATQDAVQQHLLESGDQQTAYNQALSGAEYASSGNPSNAYLNASGQNANSAAQSQQSLADLMRQYYANQYQPAARAA